MHAIRLHAFGPAENLTYEETEDPRPGPDQVRIAVRAAGVHLLDAALRRGMRGPGPAPATLPTVPGREVAGVVDAVGEGAPRDLLGRRVVAHLGFVPGGYAELAVTGTDRLHEIPGRLDFAQPVAMIGTGRTAMGIVQFAEPGPGDVIVVPAAAGGIGTLLVQYARNAGATVVGLAGGPAKTARVAAGGADLAVDYTAPGWTDRLEDLRGKVTVVYDGVGGDVARAVVGLLAPGGRHIVFGWSAEGIESDRPYLVEGVSVNVLGAEMMRKAGGPNPVRTLELRALAEAAAGRLTPAVQRFPLAEAAAAHRALENRGTTGKVVLEP
ncbi:MULTISPECIES: zinc-binding dehydrogenase [unclassified Streptomyces]|uniref:zinc-binding dehydrogenase n=1 Tax=unclassified Streptomyces TaxID=2593676 RepID=UPI000A6744B1|nr:MULTISPECIES: zinc-binding dehydrogenase [unclassified Streptomyces]AZM61536.1 oxidoreductase [Streptomyces sp. WAC 01438]RSM95487.1 oxidoreductase [Streptomyces sp. WAC 01420]